MLPHICLVSQVWLCPLLARIFSIGHRVYSFQSRKRVVSAGSCCKHLFTLEHWVLS